MGNVALQVAATVRTNLRGTSYEVRFPTFNCRFLIGLLHFFLLDFGGSNDLNSSLAAPSLGPARDDLTSRRRILSLTVRSKCWLPYSCRPIPRPAPRRRVHQNDWD